MARTLAFVLFVALFAPAARSVAQPAALTAEVRRTVDSIPNENIPLPHLHYYRSNESRHDLWRGSVTGLGGAYIGVGSDQNYTLAAMAHSEMLFLVDYDGRIPWVHAIYGALVSAAETPAHLIALFTPEKQREAEGLVRAYVSGRPNADRIVRHYSSHRDEWLRYLTRLSRLEEHGTKYTWMGDPALYAWVRGLHRNGRIVSFAGDLTGGETVKAIGRVARAMSLPVRIVYMSNAEQFFDYTPGFVENMHALPFDDRSVVLRTIRHRTIPNVDRWHYMTHEMRDFVERLDTGAYPRSFALVGDLLSAGPPFLGTELSRMDRTTPRAALAIRDARRAER